MPLAPIQGLMEDARRREYAVGYFESWSLDSLLGVIDAAEQTRSPILIGFNGDFLSARADANPEEVQMYGGVGQAVAALAKVPCGLVFNECANLAWVQRAVASGFNLVMPIDGGEADGEYTDRVARLTAVAHQRGVAVEALAPAPVDGQLTVSESATRFVHATGVDLLAVEVGNEEIRLEGRAPLDLARLEELSGQVDVPLVLHGGTGIDDESVRAAIRLGVRKINYGTYMKQRYLAALRGALDSDEANPHALLGGGSATDVLVIGRDIVRDAVLERIGLLGCSGKA